MKKRKLPHICAYCGTPRPETRDHIPPQNLFPAGAGNRLTVPCCEKCRQGQSMDDEYFRAALLTAEELEGCPEADEVRRTVVRSFMRPMGKRFARRIVSAFEEVDILTPGGFWLGRQPALRLERNRIARFSQRVIRALYFLEHGAIVQEGWRVKSTRWSPETVTEFARLARRLGRSWSPIRRAGSGIFEYSFVTAADDSPTCHWITCFYKRIYFVGSVRPRPDMSIAG